MDMERVSRKAIGRAREEMEVKEGVKKGKKVREEEGSDSLDNDDITFEDKVSFTEKVRTLTNEGLMRLVKKIKEKCKEALEDVDSERLHI